MATNTMFAGVAGFQARLNWSSGRKSRTCRARRGRHPHPDSLPAAVKGVTAVIHLAAVFRTRDDDQIWTVNRDGLEGADGHLPRP
jgi:hypothetical protein